MNLNNFEKIIIYQFGKVGSGTLYHTFKYYSKVEVQHTHDFNDLIGLKTTKPVLIINVVRNLFDRNISAMFQNIGAYGDDRGKKGYVREGYFLQNRPLMIEGNISKISDFFRKTNTEILLKSIYNKWYSDFNKYTGVDIFETPFDRRKKYKIIPGCHKTILVLRFEDIKQWENILTDIFNSNFKLVSKNLSETKPAYILHERFKEYYKYSKKETTMIKNIDFMKHFYTEDELTNLKINKL